ncbi:MAG: SPFH domain-containing protein [Candidatus Gracilibacteria bacterium]|nr:SPFH domain-containing protein [Candidatus Gracilibacteria bacterium]
MFDFFKGQFVDVIRWENPENYLLVKKFSRNLDEIKDTTNLIVDPGYGAIFVHNGKVEAIQTEGGKWELSTENIPFLTALKSWKRLGESNDKSAIYFVKTTEILNLKWGTKNPVKYVDPKYSFPIKLRAFGNLTLKISDIEKFWLNYIGTRSEVSVDEIKEIVVDRLIGQITSILARDAYSYVDIDAKRVEIANKLESLVNAEIEILGLTITDFRIEDTNFDEETEKLIMKVSTQTANVKAMNELSDVSNKAMENYTKTKNLDIMQEAAGNDGAMGGMVGTVMGMNMGNMMNTNQTSSISSGDDTELKLEKLKSMLEKNLITQEEFDVKKKEILGNM